MKTDIYASNLKRLFSRAVECEKLLAISEQLNWSTGTNHEAWCDRINNLSMSLGVDRSIVSIILAQPALINPLLNFGQYLLGSKSSEQVGELQLAHPAHHWED